jgi:hypothetical protein
MAPPTVHEMLKMNSHDLDALFSSLPAGPTPTGPAKGTAIVAAGTQWTPEIAEFISLFAWQGRSWTFLISRV